jgi:hypothetical protein
VVPVFLCEQEALRFMNVDKFWKATLRRTKENPKVGDDDNHV